MLFDYWDELITALTLRLYTVPCLVFRESSNSFHSISLCVFITCWIKYPVTVHLLCHWPVHSGTWRLAIVKRHPVYWSCFHKWVGAWHYVFWLGPLWSNKRFTLFSLALVGNFCRISQWQSSLFYSYGVFKLLFLIMRAELFIRFSLRITLESRVKICRQWSCCDSYFVLCAFVVLTNDCWVLPPCSHVFLFLFFLSVLFSIVEERAGLCASHACVC